MKTIISNLAYSAVALTALAFVLYAPDFTHQAMASATAQLYAKGAEVRGVVIGIMDGDRLKVRTDDRHELRVRLAEISAPEKEQAYGDVSKRSLSDLAYSKPATLRVEGTDQAGGVLARVFVGTLDVNLAQVGRGLAWADT